MQKIMFNDAVSLTEATLRGIKTNTRRDELTDEQQEKLTGYERVGAKPTIIDNHIVVLNAFGEVVFKKKTRYKVGEIVAVAQSYKDAGYKRGTYRDEDKYIPIFMANEDPISVATAGWSNKMYVKPEYMPERVRMNGIRIERLQDISDDDCLNEGIEASNSHEIGYGIPWVYLFAGSEKAYFTPREAYAALIDRVSGKGTWERNPYVVVYEFEKLVK